MAIYKCKNCGCDNDIADGQEFVNCEYCGTRVEAPAKMYELGSDFDMSAFADTPKAKQQQQPVDLGIESQRFARQNGPAIIYKVASIGSCDFDDCWPTAPAREVFNLDEFQIIYFHVDVRTDRLKYNNSVKSSITIYNSNNEAVHNDVMNFDWKPNYDRIARSWVIRGSDGSTVPTGKYRAEFWVEDSQVVVHNFTVTSNETHYNSEADLISRRMADGVCLLCGGRFKKGLFGQKCSVCGIKKSY